MKPLLYSLYLITHPLDGFWDLKHEKRGSIFAANVLVGLTLLTTLLKLQFTGSIFMKVRWEQVNIFLILLGILLPIGIGCLANWGLTTLFNGKGSMKDIYMAIGYALTPYVLIQFPLIFISNVLTVEEGVFYYYLSSFSQIWCVMLIVCALMMIHDYSLSKAVVTLGATIVGMMMIVFVVLLFFSVLSEAFAYFVSLYKELQYRLY